MRYELSFCLVTNNCFWNMTCTASANKSLVKYVLSFRFVANIYIVECIEFMTLLIDISWIGNRGL